MIEEKIDKYLNEEQYSKNEFKEIIKTFLKKERFPLSYIDDMINMLSFIDKNGEYNKICPSLYQKLNVYLKENVGMKK